MTFEVMFAHWNQTFYGDKLAYINVNHTIIRCIVNVLKRSVYSLKNDIENIYISVFSTDFNISFFNII